MGDDLLFYSFDILLIIENPQGRLPLPQNLMLRDERQLEFPPDDN
jgi:hypothetical protein